MLDLFLKSNHNLTEIEVSECELNVDSVRQLSLALGNCKRSLKKVEFDDNNFGDGQLVDVIAALSMHNQLEHLDLEGMDVGRSECMALSTLLQNTTKQLQTLNLSINNIDDERIEVLVHGISGSKLQELDLSYNPSITIKGLKTLSTLLEMPGSNLERLILNDNDIGNEGALVFAHSLRGNSKLKDLDLSCCYGINEVGWAHFSRLLCDTSSISKTYLSYHTLRDLDTIDPIEDLAENLEIPTDLASYLDFNGSSENKGQVAMGQVLLFRSASRDFKLYPYPNLALVVSQAILPLSTVLSLLISYVVFSCMIMNEVSTLND